MSHGDFPEEYRPAAPQVQVSLHASALLDHAAQNIAFARAHLSNAEATFEQLKQALGR
jgi:hypothetical protein